MMKALYDPITHLRSAPGDRWMFRWRFEYVSGLTKYGQWNGTSRFQDTASAQKKDGLLVAIIEGKHFLTREIRSFGECSGQDFVNFEHLAAYVATSTNPITFVYGMRLRSRNEILTVYANGSSERNDWRTDQNYIWPEWTRA